jgi:hypothetical protein
MSIAEETFIKTFVMRDRRETWLNRLASPKTRSKQLNHLAHTFDRDLDQRYMYQKDELPPHVKSKVNDLLAEWKKSDSKQLCHIIAISSERDGHIMSLQDAETDYLLTFGAIIIIIPDKLAYYQSERSNISQQPTYVLFRP